MGNCIRPGRKRQRRGGGGRDRASVGALRKKATCLGGQVAFFDALGEVERVLAQVRASDVARKLADLLAQIVLAGFGEIADRDEAN